ncbi:AN1-type zinc finger protein 1-like isoform X2 [Ostrea edulis]|uniref:AN1-type zinc finger protein 1-like isoform X2 n=1 Tax=Ostrea edulis TaxID=37623 RepID=UPI0024AF35BF|nr:AN1-type zinc finger protein 1-like isoform X2 [Ostrea edulis]
MKSVFKDEIYMIQDFLPFACKSCQQVFCLDHKFPDDHDCKEFSAETPYVEYSGTKAYTCSITKCTARELMPVVCEKCSKNFCLRHRHQNDHNCENLVEKITPTKTAEHVQQILGKLNSHDKLPATPTKTAEYVQQILGRLNSHDKLPATPTKTAEHVQQILASKKLNEHPKKTKGRKSSKTAAKVALMKMKMNAAGDKKIPEPDRVYFSVVLPGGSISKGPAKPLFFSKTWSVGRVLDAAADKVSISNTNNTDSSQKLRLFSADEGSLLPTDQTIDSLLSEETICNGCTVILERVPDDVININLDLYY